MGNYNDNTTKGIEENIDWFGSIFIFKEEELHNDIMSGLMKILILQFCMWSFKEGVLDIIKDFGGNNSFFEEEGKLHEVRHEMIGLGRVCMVDLVELDGGVSVVDGGELEGFREKRESRREKD